MTFELHFKNRKLTVKVELDTMTETLLSVPKISEQNLAHISSTVKVKEPRLPKYVSM